MRKLLTASLILASCAQQPILAQKTAAPLDKPLATAPATPPAQVPDWVAAEFGEAYGRYFLELPGFYRYTVSQLLRNTPLVDPNANLSNTLAQYAALRESVYQSIYQYCHALKYGFGSRQEVNGLVYQMLYEDFHLSDLAATRLAPYIVNRYKQPAPPPFLIVADASGASTEPASNSSPNATALYGTTSSSSRPGSGGSGLEVSGWRFESQPTVEALDDNAGFIRFKIKIADDGDVESVTKVAGNVSSAQEKLCRDKLLDANFIRAGTSKGGATGFYTFRFTIH